MKMILSKCKYICALVLITPFLAIAADTIFDLPIGTASLPSNSVWSFEYSTGGDAGWTSDKRKDLTPMVYNGASGWSAPGGLYPSFDGNAWRTAGGVWTTKADVALIFKAPASGNYAINGAWLTWGLGSPAAVNNYLEIFKSDNPDSLAQRIWHAERTIPAGSEAYWSDDLTGATALQTIFLNAGDELIFSMKTQNVSDYALVLNRFMVGSFGNWGLQIIYTPAVSNVNKSYDLAFNSTSNPNGPFTLACKHTGSWTSYNTLDLMRFVSGSTWTGYFDPANPLDAWYPYYYNSPDALWRLNNVSVANQPLVHCFKVPEDGFYSLDTKWVAQSWGSQAQGAIELARNIYLADSSSSTANLVFSDVSNWSETATDQRIVDLSAIQSLQNMYLLKDSFVFFEMKCPSSIGQVVDMWFSRYTSSDRNGRITYSCGKPGDISGPFGSSDCKVDFYDFAAMAQDWMVNDNYSPAEYGNATN